MNAGVLADDTFDRLDREVDVEIKAAIEKADAAPRPGRDRIFEGLFS